MMERDEFGMLIRAELERCGRWVKALGVTAQRRQMFITI